ncbi:hypothetical protein TcWFU_006290 [Taenia crassiceps]|uniref:Uncharacterized protein n=1 Tax=Taenia crassiceps TaxID=6207 RepID=A0ABR4QI27_9CEST
MRSAFEFSASSPFNWLELRVTHFQGLSDQENSAGMASRAIVLREAASATWSTVCPGLLANSNESNSIHSSSS